MNNFKDNEFGYFLNWKMKLGNKDALDLASGLVSNLDNISNGDYLVICPSFLVLREVQQFIQKNKNISLGAQDVFWEELGAFTGEVAADNLESSGVKWVLIGHSERRLHLSETNERINKKIITVLNHNMSPVVCVGESIEDRNSNNHHFIIETQIREAFQNIKVIESTKIMIAYEPLWAIGSGHAITTKEAIEMFELIDHVLLDLFKGNEVENNIRYLYGGSVNPKNIDDFYHKDLISGVLIGSSGLHLEDILAMMKFN